MRRFAPGTSVALREIWRGRVWSARPVTVVLDGDDLWMFYLPLGVRWMCPREPGGAAWHRIPHDEWELAERIWEDTHVLSFARPHDAHATLLFFERDWTPRTWYVNLQEPLRQTHLGFDYMDKDLDVLVELDGTWRWKDEDELAEAIAGGLIPAEDEPRLRAEGERAVRRILGREPPFDRDWTTWRPDPTWPMPTLPNGWDRLKP